MNGSVFHKDIYILLMRRYVRPYDAFVFSLTCKTLYAQFTSVERLWLLCNQWPRITSPQVRLDRLLEDFVSCRVCRVAMKATTVAQHKCSVRVVENRHDMILCTQCLSRVHSKKLEKHLKKGCETGCYKKRALNVCEKCHGRHGWMRDLQCVALKSRCNRFRWETVIDDASHLPKTKMSVCGNRVWKNRVHICDVCKNVIVLVDAWCKECELENGCRNRCLNHKQTKCLGCAVSWDPHKGDKHVCKLVEDYIWVALRKRQPTIPRLSPTVSGLLKCGDYYYIFPAASSVVPRLENFQVNRPIAVVTNDEEARELYTMYEPGVFYMPPQNTSPLVFCRWCGCTGQMHTTCTQCAHTHYCSKQCQRRHWKWHKLECID